MTLLITKKEMEMAEITMTKFHALIAYKETKHTVDMIRQSRSGSVGHQRYCVSTRGTLAQAGVVHLAAVWSFAGKICVT